MNVRFFLPLFVFLSFNELKAQTDLKADLDLFNTNIRREHFFENLSYEVGYGFAMPFSPSKDITTSDYNSILNFQIGANYEFNDLFGVRLTYAYHSFTNKYDSKIGILYNKIMLEGTMSLKNAINKSKGFNKDQVFDVVAHAGFGVTFANTKANKINEKIMNVQLGLKPSIRINNQSLFFVDINGVTNFSQHIGYNGIKFEEPNKKLTGFYLTMMLGYQFNFGKF